ncbi:MAG: hypothetical protein DHS20C19_28110 [Acidimicrobiales bacterium]|nr:MAG: hypothetical protein DHS20C19_28110 [Acidimicrobiales bacterium]
MKWKLWITGLVLAASCAGPQPPDAWSVERVTTDEEVLSDALCREVSELALGSHAAEPGLSVVLDEFARLGALAGATDALPLIVGIERTLADESLSEHRSFVQLHDLLVEAAAALDDATSAACGIPAFSATYATSGFGECHFELEIPIAAYTLVGEPGTCDSDGHPTHLPCWSTDGDHLAIDCVSGVIVQAVDGEWREAGEPRVISIDRVDPDAPPPPDTFVLVDSPACAAVASLFLDGPTPNGVIPDYDRLRLATSELDTATQTLVDAFIAAATDPPSLDEFELLVSSLDDATIQACGLPLVSAWATMTSTVAEMPCWVATERAYPAYGASACPDGA